MKERENKSQRKRELSALHQLGEQLGQLSETHLKKLELPDPLSEALKDAKRITSHGAKKRHFQFIAGIVRTMDSELITDLSIAVENLKRNADCNNAQFHNVEEWRDRFLSDKPDVLTQFLKEYTCDDIQQLRQAIKKAQKEQAKQQNLGGRKALFRLLKSII